MTVGFISAVGRLIPASENAVGATYSIPDIIQTDVSINPGNSGGVLLDDTGAVIGVTQSIDTTSGSSSGVGFAIPSAIVKQVVPELITNGHYDHPYLGCSLSLTPDIATAMNLPSGQRGALVETVASGGSADKAGLKASANKTSINGEQVISRRCYYCLRRPDSKKLRRFSYVPWLVPGRWDRLLRLLIFNAAENKCIPGHLDCGQVRNCEVVSSLV